MAHEDAYHTMFVYKVADDHKVTLNIEPLDVIELSSGDEDTLPISSEDDERSGSPGTEESSGSHINDALNQPDAQGRVLVNINHPAEEDDLFLTPQLARAVKPHQV